MIWWTDLAPWEFEFPFPGNLSSCRMTFLKGRTPDTDDLMPLGGLVLDCRIFAERELFIDNLLVRIHFIIVMIRWTGLAPWRFEFPFPGIEATLKGRDQGNSPRKVALHAPLDAGRLPGKGASAPQPQGYLAHQKTSPMTTLHSPPTITTLHSEGGLSPPRRARPGPGPRIHGVSTEQFPVSSYAGSSKNLKDLKDHSPPPPGEGIEAALKKMNGSGALGLHHLL